MRQTHALTEQHLSCCNFCNAIIKTDVQLAEMKRKFPRFAASALAEEEPSLPWQPVAGSHQEAIEQLPEAGPSRPLWDHIRPSFSKSLLPASTSCHCSRLVMLPPTSPSRRRGTRRGISSGVPAKFWWALLRKQGSHSTQAVLQAHCT